MTEKEYLTLYANVAINQFHAMERQWWHLMGFHLYSDKRPGDPVRNYLSDCAAEQAYFRMENSF
jgi:hypothetical protein